MTTQDDNKQQVTIHFLIKRFGFDTVTVDADKREQMISRLHRNGATVTKVAAA